MIYKISLPIKISYVIDSEELQIRDIEELEELQEKYDVDLQYLIDEFEYKLESEERYLEFEEDEDHDVFVINNNHLLQTVIDDNIDNLLNKLNKEYKLDALDKESLAKLFVAAQDDFKFNFKLNSLPDHFTVNSIQISGYNASESYFIIDVDVDKELSSEELVELNAIIDNKCTEEWGTKFEKNDLSGLIGEETMYVYMNCWDAENPVEFI